MKRFKMKTQRHRHTFFHDVKRKSDKIIVGAAHAASLAGSHQAQGNDGQRVGV